MSQGLGSVFSQSVRELVHEGFRAIRILRLLRLLKLQRIIAILYDLIEDEYYPVGSPHILVDPCISL